jgi:AICAR transformylase/IMP cyclohydrolase PurH
VKHVKSSAITVAKDGKLLGMGSGQPNRCEISRESYEVVEGAGEAWVTGVLRLHVSMAGGITLVVHSWEV